MKYLNAKTLKTTLLVSTFIMFSGFTGCDEEGIPDDHQLVGSTPTPPVVTPPAVTPPVIDEEPPAEEPPVVTEAECLLDAGGYEVITLANGQRWLDRNLGASQAATSASDPLAIGNYYQWGRGADGHENNESNTTTGNDIQHATTILPNTGEPWDGLFITEGDGQGEGEGSNFDWVQLSVDQNGSQRAELWGSPSSDTNLNQVCPCGFVVASVADFDQMLEDNSSNVQTLKITSSDIRFFDGEVFEPEWYYALFTTREADNVEGGGTSWGYIIDDINEPMYVYGFGNSFPRMFGLQVRCIDPATSDYSTPPAIEDLPF